MYNLFLLSQVIILELSYYIKKNILVNFKGLISIIIFNNSYTKFKWHLRLKYQFCKKFMKYNNNRKHLLNINILFHKLKN